MTDISSEKCVVCHRSRDNHKSHPWLCPICIVKNLEIVEELEAQLDAMDRRDAAM